jgi:predicted Zn-dependent peptidase
MSSRLFQEARERRGLCYSIFSQAGAYSDSGMLTIYAGTSAEDARGLVELTVDELRRAADDMSAAEVARARAQLKAGLLMGLESPSARAERLARLLAIWDRVPPLEETISLIDAVTTGDVRDHAARLAQSGRAALALYGPVATAPDLGDITGRLAA